MIRPLSSALLLGFVSLTLLPGCASQEEEPATSGAQDLTGSLKERTLSVYAKNERARPLLDRLLEGVDSGVIRDVVEEEKADLFENKKILERTNYKSSPDRVRYMDSILATQKALDEFIGLLVELDKSPTWKTWFPPTAICHSTEVVEYQVVRTIEGLIERRIIETQWRVRQKREEIVLATIEDAVKQLPQGAPQLQALKTDRVILDTLIAHEEVVVVRERLRWTLQVALTATVTHVQCPGDERIIEWGSPYDLKTYYNYAAIPKKDIFIMRQATRPFEAETGRFRSSSYMVSLQGVDARGQLFAGPVNRVESVVKIQQDGRVERGPAYDRYFTRYGMTLPAQVPADKVEAFVHMVDAYLASYLEHYDFAIALQVFFGIDYSATVTKQ